MAIIKNLSLTAKCMLLSLVAFLLLFAVLGTFVIVLIYPIEPLPKYLLGLLLGGLTSTIRLILMAKSINKAVDMPEKKAKLYAQAMFLLRYSFIIIFAAILIIFHNIFGVYGGVIGILCLQLSGYSANYLLIKYEKKNGKGKTTPNPSNRTTQ